MKTLTIFFLLATLVASMAFEIKPGIKIDELESEMKKHGYKSSSCGDNATKVDGGDLECYIVGQGTLFVTYLKHAKTVVGLSYQLSDNKSKLERTTFILKVLGFDPANGEMRIAPRAPDSVRINPDRQ